MVFGGFAFAAFGMLVYGSFTSNTSLITLFGIVTGINTLIGLYSFCSTKLRTFFYTHWVGQSNIKNDELLQITRAINAIQCNAQSRIAHTMLQMQEQFRILCRHLEDIHAIKKVSPDTFEDSKEYLEKVRSLASHLEEYEETLRVCTKNALDEILEHGLPLFSQGKKIDPPRICLKLLKENDATSEEEVVRCYEKIAYFPISHGESGRQIEHTRDTGVETVHTNKDYYVCNDVPKAFARKGYFNERLSERPGKKEEQKEWNEARGVMRCLRHIDFIYNFYVLRRMQKNWPAYWKNPNRREEAYYKSTLIIPLAIKHNENIDPDIIIKLFNRRFQGRIHPFSSPLPLPQEEDRDALRLGMLCLDSCSRNAFLVRDGRSSRTISSSLDLQLGYFIADSLFVFIYMSLHYSQLSERYMTARKLCDSV